MNILLIIGAVVVIVVVIVAMQPAEFRLSRSTKVSAPPPAVFAQVNDFHNWENWSPWAKIDPAMKQTYSGAPAGNGAIYEWAGNSKAGAGRMTIVESRPGELVRIKLEFLKPFQAENQAEFTFHPQGNQTAVTWTMTGRKNFMFKAVHLLMSMEKMVGGQFEQGLAQMKAVAEARQ
ncbi:MAG TPA: SRPBCC family protein [Verrucomicrobiae bacterium]|nr:SRPBCC family protein [Verrucomicrobiae bacterium]